MQPLLAPGNEVLVDPSAYRASAPQPGDLVIAQHPLQPELRMVKRVEAVVTGPRYVLKGDNPTASTDSRAFGAVGAEHILGKVTCCFG
jgi:nickel-type superoxide dismutase maturation protease